MYSALSKELTTKIAKGDKQAQGIYFTPPSCIAKNLALLAPYSESIKNVLEPACGSGEYLTALQAVYPALNLTGIEYNATIFQAIAPLANEKLRLLNLDYLAYTPATKFDLIIGNPPYYVLKKAEVDKLYWPYFDGRPNIFLLFLIKSFELLREEGLLSFVLPKNFLNCLYYDKTRAYLNKHGRILHIVDCEADKYLETQQETIIFIVQKLRVSPPKIKIKRKLLKHIASVVEQTQAHIAQQTQAHIAQQTQAHIAHIAHINSAFVFKRNTYTIFATPENIQTFQRLYQHSKTLNELGYKVSVGTVVWNQCKDILTTDPQHTRLIYSSDIAQNTLSPKTYTNLKKKNFIQQPGWTHQVLVVNRGYGVGDYKFNYCLIDGPEPYLLENHLIYIEGPGSYEKIMASLIDPRTTAFIKAYFGNNAINTTELGAVLPIYQDI